ncbi:hypothetical protein EV294_104393 [Paenibacillus sp. BK033]|nr:hypothetical protein EV294_104393 [Paenibacillus sp. BK033]
MSSRLYAHECRYPLFQLSSRTDFCSLPPSGSQARPDCYSRFAGIRTAPQAGTWRSSAQASSEWPATSAASRRFAGFCCRQIDCTNPCVFKRTDRRERYAGRAVRQVFYQQAPFVTAHTKSWSRAFLKRRLAALRRRKKARNLRYAQIPGFSCYLANSYSWPEIFAFRASLLCTPTILSTG